MGERREFLREEDPEGEYCSSLGLLRCVVCDLVDVFLVLAKRLSRFLKLYELRERLYDFHIRFMFKHCVPYVSDEEQREIDEILKSRDWEHGEYIPLEEFLKELGEKEKKSQ